MDVVEYEREQNLKTRRVINCALDDLATPVLLAKVPCEICGKCADTLSPCALCNAAGGMYHWQ